MSKNKKNKSGMCECLIFLSSLNKKLSLEIGPAILAQETKTPVQKIDNPCFTFI